MNNLIGHSNAKSYYNNYYTSIKQIIVKALVFFWRLMKEIHSKKVYDIQFFAHPLIDAKKILRRNKKVFGRFLSFVKAAFFDLMILQLSSSLDKLIILKQCFCLENDRPILRFGVFETWDIRFSWTRSYITILA